MGEEFFSSPIDFILIEKRQSVMLFNENKIIDASKYRPNTRACIQLNGRLGFTLKAAELLELQEGQSALFSMISNGNMAAVICDKLEPRGFKIQKDGTHFYIHMKNFFDSQNIEYIKKRVFYDISETNERYQNKIVYKFTLGIHGRKRQSQLCKSNS